VAERFPEFVALKEQVDRCFQVRRGAEGARLVPAMVAQVVIHAVRQGSTVEEIVETLKAEGTPWAKDCLAKIEAASPTRWTDTWLSADAE
jgi:hypothetical protein